MARIGLVLSTVVLLCAPCRAQSPPVTDHRVRQAMDRIEQYLWRIQDQSNGGWDHYDYPVASQEGGETALVVTAMLARGISGQHPKMQQAIGYLSRTKMQGTYAVALRAHVWAQMPRTYHEQLAIDSRWLLRAADKRSRFAYGSDKRGSLNHSTTHYGLLGLWEVAKSNIHVPPKIWAEAEDYFMDAQNADGGWGYNRDHPSTGSMTAAGLTMLLIAQQELHRGEMTVAPRRAEAIADGMRWLDRRFIGGRNVPEADWNYYYLYAIERVALASGVRVLNDLDWFAAGAKYILRDQESNGSIDNNSVRSAFALAFLARGRVPVWITKLTSYTDQWDHRPNDIYYLTRYLSDLRESELNWQRVDIDTDLTQWRDVPAAYMANKKSFKMTVEQKASLKQYLDSGGTLLVNPDNGASTPGKSIRKFAAEMYPQWPVRVLPEDHPMFNALHKVEHRRFKVYGVGNGVRELMIIAERDWGYAWQSSAKPGVTPPWRLAVNFWATVTDRGLLQPRLVPRLPVNEGRQPTGYFNVARARYDGNWLPEPLAWELFGIALLNRTGRKLKTEDVDVADLANADVPLVHLVGVDPAVFSEAQLDAIANYARTGGTVLVETAGGRGSFAQQLEKQLAAKLGNMAVPIAFKHPLISGEGMKDAYNAKHAQYRRYAVATLSPGNRPRLAAFMFDQRPAIIISNEDFTQGMIRTNHWGVVGYDNDTVDKLLTNLVIWSKSAGK